MICVASLIVFSILGIFSANYREKAREAFRCVLSRGKSGECETGFETQVKSTVVGRLLEKNPRLARMVNNNFRILSWVFVVLFLVSGIFTTVSVYNYAQYGNCNGPDAQEGCTYDKLLGGNSSETSSLQNLNVTFEKPPEANATG